MGHRFLFSTVLPPISTTQNFSKRFLICDRTKHYHKNQILFKSVLCLVEPQFSHKVDLLRWGEMAMGWGEMDHLGGEKWTTLQN